MNFLKAFRFYNDLYCNIGVKFDREESFFGAGCVLSEEYLLTARHIVKKRIRLGGYPVAMKHDGYFKCEIAFELAELDIIILKVISKGEVVESKNRIKQFPKIKKEPLSIGLAVGYIGDIKTHDEKNNLEPRLATCFSQAYISFIQEPNFLGLSGGIVQQGFSGSPVFSEDTKLLGMIVRCQPYISDYENPVNTTNILPIMAPLYPIYARIQKFL